MERPRKSLIYLQDCGIAAVAAVDDEGLRRVGPGGRQGLAELLQAGAGRPAGEACCVTAVAKGHDRALHFADIKVGSSRLSSWEAQLQ